MRCSKGLNYDAEMKRFAGSVSVGESIHSAAAHDILPYLRVVQRTVCCESSLRRRMTAICCNLLKPTGAYWSLSLSVGVFIYINSLYLTDSEVSSMRFGFALSCFLSASGPRNRCD